MRVEIPKPLKTERAPEGVKTPWLKGRGPKRMVSEDWWVKADGAWYKVWKGYIFNGSSIPWFLWWLFPPGYSPAWEASCFHDLCYSHLWRKVPKTFADAAFRAIMLKDGAKPWVAGVFHFAVQKFGQGGW